MSEGSSEEMNLDLNLGPGPEEGSGSVTGDAVNVDNLDEWIEEPVHRRIREAVRHRARQRWRWRQVPIPQETPNISMALDQLMASSGNGSTLQAGEGSVAPEERPIEVPKACENNNGFSEEDGLDTKDEIDKGVCNDGSFFDCNICLDLATDPVVTCCGHLFCWSCLYRWLNVHSDTKECPVCKGEVTVKSVTPIYGRGNNIHMPEEESSLKIPMRPQARRVESWSQTIQRTALAFPVEVMVRRLGSRFDLTHDMGPLQDTDIARESLERNSSLLNRILTSRGFRREQNPVPPQNEVVDLTQSGTTNPEVGEPRQLRSLLLRRVQSQRNATLSSLSSALNSAERLVETYFQSHPTARNLERPPPVDDRDSFSSIAAVINSESQTMDTAVEIDSLVSLSTSSSRRRNDASRVSDLDSGDSRAPRRRRLN